ncbi:hypothetical protein ACFL7M_10845, partial [Thermodesulfobacteriota bacterium]
EQYAAGLRPGREERPKATPLDRSRLEGEMTLRWWIWGIMEHLIILVFQCILRRYFSDCYYLSIRTHLRPLFLGKDRVLFT